MQTKLENKHHKKRKLRKEIYSTGIILKSALGLILFNALHYKLNIAIKSRQKSVIYLHQKKLFYKQNISNMSVMLTIYMINM